MTNLGGGNGTLEVCCMSCFRCIANAYITDSSSSPYGWCDYWKEWGVHQQHTANLWYSIAIS